MKHLFIFTAQNGAGMGSPQTFSSRKGDGVCSSIPEDPLGIEGRERNIMKNL